MNVSILLVAYVVGVLVTLGGLVYYMTKKSMTEYGPFEDLDNLTSSMLEVLSNKFPTLLAISLSWIVVCPVALVIALSIIVAYQKGKYG